MIVKCEKCQIAFNINDKLIRPGGSKLRCSKCKHIFTVFPPEPSVKQKAERQVPRKPSPERSRRPASYEMKRASSSLSSGAEATLTMVDFAQDVFFRGDASERYEEMGSIGKGGMGEVLLARDTQLLRKVAIKVMRDQNVSAAALSFFIREAQITAQLDHPNIVPVYTVRPPEKGEKNVSFVMKLIKGKTFFEIITKARTIYSENPKAELSQELTLRTRLEHFLKACDGITYAHRKQVVHRDLKPANIMVGDFGEVYVMDWGIAKMLKDDEEALTALGTAIFTGAIPQSQSKSDSMDLASVQPEGVVGTLTYMSPEQAKGRLDVSMSSDIFSLGVILFELVTLKPARVGDAKEKLRWAENGYINQMSHLVPEQKIDPELKAIIHKATEFNPKDRYPTVAALSEDIRRYLRGDEVSQLPDNLPRKVIRWMGKHRQMTMIIFMAVLLLSSTVTIASLYREQSAMKAAQIRERKLSQLQATVSAQAHLIDSRFLRLEDLAVGLTNNAIYLIENAPPNDELFYWISDFQNPRSAPADHSFSQLYQRPVSIDYPVVKTAPGVRKEDISSLMQRLAPLRHHFKTMLLDSRSSLGPISEVEARRLLTIHGLPIRWAYIGLEAGVMYSYPGKGTYPDDYDPRVRPWYKLGAHKNAVYWGNPYVDLQGQGLVLPCATSLYGKDNQFYGVLGMDVTFSDIIQDNLTRKGSVGVIESFLLDNQARIIVRSSQTNLRGGDTSNPALDLAPFSVPMVADAVRRGESGLREADVEGKSRLIVFYQMSSLHWYYVEQIDTAAYIGSTGGPP